MYDFKKSLRQILGYHSGVAGNSSLLGCCAVSAGLKLKDAEKDRKAFLDYLTQNLKTLTYRNVGTAQQSTRLYSFSVSLCK
jgi:hypothetical protein